MGNNSFSKVVGLSLLHVWNNVFSECCPTWHDNTCQPFQSYPIASQLHTLFKTIQQLLHIINVLIFLSGLCAFHEPITNCSNALIEYPWTYQTENPLERFNFLISTLGALLSLCPNSILCELFRGIYFIDFSLFIIVCIFSQRGEKGLWLVSKSVVCS